MIDHVSIAVSDLARAGAFFDGVLSPLALRRLATREHQIGYGKRYPELWLNLRAGMTGIGDDTGAHVALRAPSTDAVDRFHTAALSSGGRCAGQPGWRDAHVTRYYGAFVRDPDGNKIEAVTFERTS